MPWRTAGPCSALHLFCPQSELLPRDPDLIYPLDYGYLEGTQAADGSGIDVWVGSLPERSVTGAVVTADRFKREAEIKILIGCTAEEAEIIQQAQDGGPMSALLMRRE